MATIEIELEEARQLPRRRDTSTGEDAASAVSGRDQFNLSEDHDAFHNAAPAIPDGGYGWIVVLACSVLTFIFNGWAGAWGVLQIALLQSTSLRVSTSTISFVGSLGIACIVAFGLFSTRLSRTIGARASALLGILLFGLGVLCSSFTADNIGGLFITAGVLTGIGGSLLYSVCNAVPVQWFSSKLGTANGVVKAGGGLGATAMSIVFQVLVDRVGIVWTLRIVGIGVFVAGLPAAALVRERVPSSRNVPFVDWALFKRLPFTFVFLTGAIGTFALFVPLYFLPLFVHSIGLSPTFGAGLVAGYNLCAAVGRLLAGFACDKLGALNVLLLTMALNTVSMLAIWPVSSNIAPLVVFSAVNGVANGAFFVVLPTAVVSLTGPGLADVAMGMVMTGWTGGYLMGSPLAGLLILSTGAAKGIAIEPFRPAIFYAGGVAAASCVCVSVARFTLDTKLKKKL
ncbi:major facilitator superfamily domain-containing protein [Lophiotrema nucula]|uniref:Major facilitator superfamily domain-containing protein n=1 Tax=Lophiotrema nucula TaxID=690887 RepID=A0A6A5ZEM5_9PLEO|nr:major facilitator superfamily domain-containing protein [Lophiotrema nucula]